VPAPPQHTKHACKPHRWTEAAIIVPYNATVGRSGSVLVTFKSPSSVPPYRIENRTKAVMLMLRQQLDQPGAQARPAAGAGPGTAAAAAAAAAAGAGPAAAAVAAAAALRAEAAGLAKREVHSPRCAVVGVPAWLKSACAHMPCHA
jgi:hypothetical protein